MLGGCLSFSLTISTAPRYRVVSHTVERCFLSIARSRPAVTTTTTTTEVVTRQTRSSSYAAGATESLR